MGKVTRNLLLTVFLLVGCSQGMFAQLSNFSLTVTKTNETCTANGSLTFNVSGTTAGSTILYSIYRLPDVTTPIAVLSANTFTGLVAGNYRVVATQSLGGESGTQSQDITIFNQITLLTYQLVKANVVCGLDGSITVNTTNGTAVSYEIFAGPVIRPLQTSNVFTGLPSGQYSVRVFDACGEGVVQAVTVSDSTTNLSFSVGIFRLVSCESINTFNTLGAVTANDAIAYPLTVEYAVVPPFWASLNFTQVIPSGAPDNRLLQQVIPFYYDQAYSYTITVTNACGRVYTVTRQINAKLKVSLYLLSEGCGKKLSIVPQNFFGPYNITFLQAPAGFDPVVFNVAHPGPFTETSGPEYYNATVPLPSGTYIVELTDSCGRTATSTINVNVSPPQQPTLQTDTGCEVGQGGFYIFSQFYELSTLTITTAPPGFQYVLPYTTNEFRMGSLPAGNYHFAITSVCGFVYQLNATIQGYQETNVITIKENCGAFDIDMHHTANNTGYTKFYLQKWNPLTNQWTHPLTGIPYTDGTEPTTLTAIQLTNNT